MNCPSPRSPCSANHERANADTPSSSPGRAQSSAHNSACSAPASSWRFRVACAPHCSPLSSTPPRTWDTTHQPCSQGGRGTVRAQPGTWRCEPPSMVLDLLPSQQAYSSPPPPRTCYTRSSPPFAPRGLSTCRCTASKTRTCTVSMSCACIPVPAELVRFQRGPLCMGLHS